MLMKQTSCRFKLKENTGGLIMNTYENQQAWKEIQNFIPKEYRFNTNYKPQEESWDYQGHKIHIDRFKNKDAKAKILCLHGVGTNGRQISMIMAGPMSKLGYETIAPDMPTYGISAVNKKHTVTYDDWVDCASAFLDEELKKDNLPIFIYGLSAGGMQAYHVATKNKSKRIKGVIGMTFLDQRLKDVRLETTNNKFWGYFGTPLATISTKMGLTKFKMKMSIPSKMRTLVNDKDCLKVMLKDKTSAGNKVTMKFLDSYMNYIPEIEGKDFDHCPILLTQPEKDKWTPEHLSDLFLKDVSKVTTEKIILRNGSHYPIEKEALTDLHKATNDFIIKHL